MATKKEIEVEEVEPIDSGWEPLFPDVVVQITGQPDTASEIINSVKNALRAHGYAGQIPAFEDEALSGSYDDLIATCMKWVDVE